MATPSFSFVPALLPERYRFVAWGGSGFVPVSDWRLPGYELCASAGDLRVTLPAASLMLVSSRRGWMGGGGLTADQWFSYLSCGSIEPWKSAFNSFGHGG